MQDRPLLADINRFPLTQAGHTARQVGRPGQINQQIQGTGGNPVLGIIQQQPVQRNREAGKPVWFGRK